MNTTLDLPVDFLLAELAEGLQPEAVLDACREQLDRVDADTWRHARMLEALYHPGRYLRIAYVLCADASVPDHRLWPEGQIVYLHAPLRAPMSRRGTVLSINGAQLEAYRFPNDRRLRGLRSFAGRDSAARTWQGWLDRADVDARIDPDSLQRLLVRYVPEQKWIVRLRAEATHRATGEVGKRRIAVRSADPHACATLLHRHTLLRAQCEATGAAFEVPPVIGDDVSSGLLAVEWNRGKTLVETLRAGSADEVMKAMASALRSFHAVPVADLELLTFGELQRCAREAAADLTLCCPELSTRVNDVYSEVYRRVEAMSMVDAVTLHNDLHWNQVRIKHDRFAILDLERMVVGDPLIDVANFATQLRMLGQRPELDVESAVARQWASAFLEQWQSQIGRPIDAVRFRVFAVVSLLQLARGMMRHLRIGWRDLAHRCVEAAEIELENNSRELIS